MHQLSQIADYIRWDVMRVAITHGRGHIAPSLSCVDILVALFYGGMGPEDQFILSKAHGGYGYYAILADKGILPRDRWERFDLPGCVERMPEYNIIAGCGSLGHGLPMAAGLGYSLQLRQRSGTVFCLIGDGELQEGSNWEAIQFIVRHRLPVVLIVDDNGLQAMDFTENVMGGNHIQQLLGFGLTVHPCISDPVKIQGKLRGLTAPCAMNVVTLKGHGMPCAENIAKFHYRLPWCAEVACET